MGKKSKASVILGIIVLVITVFLTLGVQFVFPSCGAQEDGSYMSCHWAQEAVKAAGIILMIMAAVMLVMHEKMIQNVLSICIGASAIVTALIPNIVIKLCMMPSMHCNAVMRPCVLACCAVLVIICVINLIMNIRKSA